MVKNFLLIACLSLILPVNSSALRQMEKLSRGVVAVVQTDGKVFVSWLMFGTDADNIAFNLYRETNGKAIKLNDNPIADVTFFVDETADLKQANAYFVRAVSGKKETETSAEFTLAANSEAKQYLSIRLQTPAGYTPNDASVGDLDGDGEYEIVLHQVGRGADNSRAGLTTEPILQAYRLDGRLLWTINLGRNIREGAHYTQFLVYDFDGDGRAEVACKTADGSTDGLGKVIGDPTVDWRDTNAASRTFGQILQGPEYLPVFDGRT